jgi:hypothetical protein
MPGRHKQPNSANDATVPAWRWPRSERARRWAHERADAELISEIRWQWRNACLSSITPLAPIVYTPTGTTRGVPVIGHVDLGPPVSLTVRIRPGQTIADFIAAPPSIAAALNAESLQVIPISAHWVRIVLLPASVVALPNRSSEPDIEARKFGA